MWDAMDGDPVAGKPDAGSYDHLIDAEREALGRSGRGVGKIALIKAVRGATGLGLKESKDAVEGYFARRDGRASSASNPDRAGGWIDDLLDAERAAASREGRPVTKILLMRALRGAAGLGLKETKDAVEDYLRRRGGEGLPSGAGGWGVAASVAVIVLLVGVVALALR